MSQHNPEAAHCQDQCRPQNHSGGRRPCGWLH